MTVYEIYDQAIKPLRADERLRIARLILDDLVPEGIPDRPFDVPDQAHLEDLLLAGLNSGPGLTADTNYWEQKEDRLTKRSSPA